MSDAENTIRNRIKYRHKSIWMCYLCHKDGREVTFNRDKEWYEKDIHMLRLHQGSIIHEAVEKYLKPVGT